MSLIHQAEITPSKTDLIADWLRSRPWFTGDTAASPEKVAAFRFDDPEGLVGIEFLLVRAGDGAVLQVPVTYRDSPLDGAEAALLGTMEHSVLGTRYVYDGLGDPALLAAVATAALTGGVQADEYYETDGVRAYREPAAVVAGSGAAQTAIVAPHVASIATRDSGAVSVSSFDGVVVAVARIPGIAAAELAAALGHTSGTRADVITGTWVGHDDPVTLAAVVRS